MIIYTSKFENWLAAVNWILSSLSSRRSPFAYLCTMFDTHSSVFHFESNLIFRNENSTYWMLNVTWSTYNALYRSHEDVLVFEGLLRCQVGRCYFGCHKKNRSIYGITLPMNCLRKRINICTLSNTCGMVPVRDRTILWSNFRGPLMAVPFGVISYHVQTLCVWEK